MATQDGAAVVRPAVGWLIAGLVLLWLLVALAMLWHARISLKDEVAQRNHLFQRGSEVALAEARNGLVNLAQVIATDPHVQALVDRARAAVTLEGGKESGPEAQRAKKDLRQLLEPMWAAVNGNGVRLLQVRLETGQASFLRMTMPQQEAGALLGAAPLAERVMATGKLEAGFSAGRQAGGYHVAAPIYAPGADSTKAKPVAVVELGSGLCVLVKQLGTVYGIQAGLLFKDKGITESALSDPFASRQAVSLPGCGCFLDGAQGQDLVAVLRHTASPMGSGMAEGRVVEAQGRHWLVSMVPLPTAGNNTSDSAVTSALVGAQSVEDLYQRFDATVLHVCLGVLAGLLISLAAFARVLRRDRSHLENRLSASERWRQSLFDISPSPVKETDAEGRIIQVNPAYLWLMRQSSRDALLGRLASMLEPGEVDEQVKQDFWAAMHANRVWQGRFFNSRLGDDGFWDAVQVVPMSDQTGRLQRMLWFHYDVSSEYRQIESARNDLDMLDVILSASPAVTYRIDVERRDRVDYISRNLEALFGYRPEELYQSVGWWIEHIHPEDRERALAEGDWTQWQDDRKESRYRLLHADGRYGWVIDTARLLRDQENKPLALVGALADQDHQIRLERRLEESERLHRLIFDNVTEAIFLIQVDEQGAFRYLGNNPEHARATGLSKEAMEGRAPEEILPAEVADWVTEKYRSCVAARETIWYEEELDLPAGHRYWHTVLTPVINEEGRVDMIVGLGIDQTTQQQTRQALSRYAEQLERAQSLAQLAYVNCDLKRADCSCSTLIRQWFGETDGDERQGWPRCLRHLLGHVLRADRDRAERMLADVLSGASSAAQLEVTMLTEAGEERVMFWDLATRANDDGQVEKLMATVQDITERVAAEQAIRVASRRNSAILQTVGDGIFGIDQEGRINFTNPAARQMLGVTEAIHGERAVDVVYGGQPPSVTFLDIESHTQTRPRRGVQDAFVSRDGKRFPVRYSITPLCDEYDPENRGAVVVFSDITEIKQTEAGLRELATTDELTGLPNRRYFMRRLEEEYQRGRRYATDASVLMLDIDLFKQINDRYGHAAGDMVLQRFAEACRSVLRQTDICGRLGGEEFAVLLPNTAKDGALEMAERLRAAIEALAVDFDGESIGVTCSFGVCSLLGPWVQAAGEALICADVALYQAKSEGRNRVCWCDSAHPEHGCRTREE